MKKNKIILASLLAGSTTLLSAQGEADAIKYSRTEITGTARSMGMGGAFNALGGDASSLATNPAGIGVYTTSEASFTMNLNFTNTQTNWNGSLMNGDKTKFNVDNVAYIASFPTSSGNNFNVGISFNKRASFDRTYTAGSSQIGTSLTDYIAYKTNGILNSDLDDLRDLSGSQRYDPYLSQYGLPWLGVLGWNSFLIQPAGSSTSQYVSQFPTSISPDAAIRVRETGRMDEYNFTFGGSYEDLVYYGATLSVTDFTYRTSSIYSEDFGSAGSFSMNNDLTTRGTGLGFRAGLIVRPADFLRLGFAVHTPTYYKLTDSFNADVVYRNVKEGEEIMNGSSATPRGAVDYKLRTSYKLSAGAAVVLGKSAIVSLDYDFEDSPTMKLKDADGYEFTQDNDYMKQDLKAIHTMKIGAEYRVTPQFSLRAGYAYQSPQVKDNVLDGGVEVVTYGTLTNYTLPKATTYYTAGMGFKMGRAYADIAYVHKKMEENLFVFAPIYDSNGSTIVPSDPINLKSRRSNVVLTLGFKF